MACRRPDLTKDFHPTKNGEMSPEMIAPGIAQNLWWKCHVCNHEWQAYGHTRLREKGGRCPGCAKRTVTSTYNLAAVHPRIAAEWHPTKNGGKKPEEFTPGSGTRAWWLGECGHEWEARISNRKTQGCPICASNRMGDLSAHPHLIEQLHPCESNRTDFRSSERCWWKCPDCQHEWKALVGQRKFGTGCPACAGLVATSTNCLAATHPKLAAEWHPTKNTLTPSQVVAGSNKRIWWQCKGCQGEWDAVVVQRYMGSGCPHCAGNGGYDQKKPGFLYVLAGGQYGKIGISNRHALKSRLASHRCSGIYGEPVAVLDFNNGSDALQIETRLKRILRTRYGIKGSFAGHTEAFPPDKLADVLLLVLGEISRQGTRASFVPKSNYVH